MSDHITRFLFDQADVRGEHVQLHESYREVLSAHHYPPAVRQLLGQFMAAASLLSATIKFDGTLTLQARSQGDIPLIMAEASSHGELRAIAKFSEPLVGDNFNRLLADGQLCITIDPERGKRYQGIVSLEGQDLAACIEAYFRQSEQLSTRLWLAADEQCAAGLLLQELPSDHPDKAFWQHVSQLAETLRPIELCEVDCETLLYRLYHEDTLRLFPAKPLFFHCSCSRERIGKALITLGRQELDECIAEQGAVDINCEFCNRHYRFETDDIQALFEPDNPRARH